MVEVQILCLMFEQHLKADICPFEVNQIPLNSQILRLVSKGLHKRVVLLANKSQKPGVRTNWAYWWYEACVWHGLVPGLSLKQA
jgi:hypothetical protein